MFGPELSQVEDLSDIALGQIILMSYPLSNVKQSPDDARGLHRGIKDQYQES